MSQGQNEPPKKKRVGFSRNTFEENKKRRGSLDDLKKVGLNNIRNKIDVLTKLI